MGISTCIALTAWSVSSPEVFPIAIMLIGFSLVGIDMGYTSRRDPLACGMVGGATGALVIGGVFWAVQLVCYSCYGLQSRHFEGGFGFECVFLPLFIIVVLELAGAAVGAIVGGVAAWIVFKVTRRK